MGCFLNVSSIFRRSALHFRISVRQEVKILPREAELSEPEIQPLDVGVLVALYRDYLNSEQLKQLRLNQRKIIAVQFVKENNKRCPLTSS